MGHMRPICWGIYVSAATASTVNVLPEGAFDGGWTRMPANYRPPEKQ